MTDHQPFYAPFRKPAPPKELTPGEPLFEFYREQDHARFLCELRDHGQWGVEAQFYQNEVFGSAGGSTHAS
jgi:hypothetical protein